MENANKQIKKSKNMILFEDFCEQHKIKLIGTYDNITQKTIIEFNCDSCNTICKKSFKLLTRNKDISHIAAWAGTCNRCFYYAHH